MLLPHVSLHGEKGQLLRQPLGRGLRRGAGGLQGLDPAGEGRAAPVAIACAGVVDAVKVVDVDQGATAEDADRDEKKKIQASSSAASKFDVYRRSSKAAETSH